MIRSAFVTLLILASCSSTGGDTPDAGTTTDAGTTVDAGNPPTGSPIGGACTLDTDCAGTGAKCLTQFPGGYCIQEACSLTADTCAGADTTCVPGKGTGTLCVASCDIDIDCKRFGDGYRCD